MTIEERIDRLEKLWEKDHHELELIEIYLPKIVDWLPIYLNASAKHRVAVLRDLKNMSDAILKLDDNQQEHFKVHTDKKKKITEPF